MITCKNKYQFTTDVSNVHDPYVNLNKLTGWDSDFKKIKGNYVSQDPRLISAAHSGQRLALDNIPLNGKVQLYNVPYINGHNPSGYSTYSDIDGGQITYYYNKELAIPFINTLFTQPSNVRKENYVDPMDSYKPHYTRKNKYSNHCLNWIRDSQFHREDLMSKQIWNRNQTNFEVDLESKNC